MIINNDNEKKRAELFLDNRIMVHISKTDRRFINGYILNIGTDYFTIKDRITNVEEFVFFSELKKPIQKFMEIDK